ncbi:Dihydropteroate synthase-like protein [Leptodontidium sp. 2 PMI_412]|nr:Dihydropteroate synthase-like protein [Leptodontidium sp. 2 PMI_412]
MRAFRVGGKIGGRRLTSKYGTVSKSAPIVGKTAISSTIRRHQSSSNGPLKPSPWTPHSLNSSTSPSKDASEISRISKSSKPAQKHLAYIALGGNIGVREKWIEKACHMMPQRGIYIKRTSCLWETEPMYVKAQHRFLNGVAEVETSLEPLALLGALQSIENELGRVKLVDKGPRNIDLDILLYDDQVVDHPRLQVPHPLMFEREFVLRPLAELIPGKPLDSKNPWKVTQDYLNELPISESVMTTVTPLPGARQPLRSLDPRRSTRIMAILNASPESFSNKGQAREAGLEKLIKSRPKDSLGSDDAINAFDQFSRTSPESPIRPYHVYETPIMDVGGQSTAPGVEEVPVEEETARVLELIEKWLIPQSYLNISVDTYRASVARAAVKAGASIINDVSAGTMDPDMLPTMAELGATVVLMHMRGTPQTMAKLTSYPAGLISTIASELLERVAAAEAAGIRRWRIILDPGIGFAKTAEQNVEILRRLDELRDWPGLRGLPWLVGSSRKSFIGKITGVETADERIMGTAVTVAAAVQGGADIVRVHDVDAMLEATKMADAIWR